MLNKILILMCLSLATLSTAFAAEKWIPSQPIEIVVPFPPGGATDRYGRVVAAILSDHGWPAVVLNKPGGGTIIASNYVAQARPDGHTLYATGSSGFLVASLADHEKPSGVDFTLDSFTDISTIGSGSLVLVAANNVPVNSYQEFIQYIKSDSQQFKLGFWNTYISNLFRVWANKEGMAIPEMVMYRGSAPMLTDVQGTHLPFAFDTFNAVAPFVNSGKMKVIAVLDTHGAKTVQQSIDNYDLHVIGKHIPEVNLGLYYGVVGPAGISPEITQAINTVINAGLKNPKYTQSMIDGNLWINSGAPLLLTQQHQEWRNLYNNAVRHQ